MVVGSGIAGLFTAVLAAQQGRVAVVTKGTLSQTNTRWAQGGIAAAIAADNTAALHAADTLAAGAGLCDPEAVRVLCAEGPARIRDLIHAGVDFDTVDGVISLAMEGAHSRRRVLHARGDATGAEIEHALTRRAVHSGARPAGAPPPARPGRRQAGAAPAAPCSTSTRSRYGACCARHVVLATGGGGYLFAHTTNPPVATADGVAVALRAGAEVADLEFFQFHPTALMLSGAPRFLISEAARGDGAYLAQHPRGALHAPLRPAGRAGPPGHRLPRHPDRAAGHRRAPRLARPDPPRPGPGGGALPHHHPRLPALRDRDHPPAHSGGPRRPLHDRRDPHRRLGAHVPPRALRRRGVRLQRRPRGQPPGLQQPPGGRRVRPAHRRRQPGRPGPGSRPPAGPRGAETEAAPPVEVSALPALPTDGASRPGAHLGPGARPALGAGQHHPRRGGPGRGGGDSPALAGRVSPPRHAALSGAGQHASSWAGR